MNDQQDATLKKEKLTKRQKTFLAALDKNLGNVSDAAAKTGISRDCHYHWKDRSPRYCEELKLINERVLDFTESCLHKQIQDGNTSATIFKLKCLGKSRGYIERYEFEDVTPIDLSKLTYDELCAYKSRKLSEQQLKQIVASRLGSGDRVKEKATDTVTNNAPDSQAV
jgi:hypothetical protein